MHSNEFAAFCAEAHPQLVAALAHHFGDRWLAEELAQEALVRAGDRWSKVSTLASPVGWAFRVGVNIGSSRFRRQRAERRALRRIDSRAEHDDPDTATRVAVREALLRLAPGQREAIVLRYFLGLSAEQTAVLTGSTAGAVRGATHRALRRLRQLLDDPDDLSQEVTGAY